LLNWPFLSRSVFPRRSSHSCLRFILTYSGPQFDVVIFNDHVVGGAEDKLAAWLLGTLSGAAAMFCGLRIWSILRAASSGER
jgi:hypothetical protein